MDPDRLVLLALSDDGPMEPEESNHLAECPGCRRDFDELRIVADLGAEGEELRDLPAPPEWVWLAVEREIESPPRPGPEHARRTGPARRWRLPVLAAAAAAVLGVAGTIVVTEVMHRAPAEEVTARATLSALPTVPATAHGTVRVLADGEMRIDVRDLPLTTGFHEVWLIDPDDPTKMVSLGNLNDRPDVVLPVPPGVDMNRYRLVDVSDEPHDGDAAHSGRSLLRGTLTS
jgi:anti-sigma-K factor RskA